MSIEDKDAETSYSAIPGAADAEDSCRFCGAHVGYGPPDLHIGVCDKPACREQGRRAGKKRRVRRFYRGRGLR